MTKREAVIVSAFTQVLIVDLETFFAYASEKLNKPIKTVMDLALSLVSPDDFSKMAYEDLLTLDLTPREKAIISSCTNAHLGEYEDFDAYAHEVFKDGQPESYTDFVADLKKAAQEDLCKLEVV